MLTPGDAKAIATAAAGNAKATSQQTQDVGEVDLISTLHDGDATGVFMAYARQDLSEENLEFFLAVASFRLAYDSAADEAAQKALADEIVATYLKAGAPKQVCIGDNKVKLLLEEIAGGGGIHREMWFNPASIALRTLAEDIFPRFQVSGRGQGAWRLRVLRFVRRRRGGGQAQRLCGHARRGGGMEERVSFVCVVVCDKPWRENPRRKKRRRPRAHASSAASPRSAALSPAARAMTILSAFLLTPALLLPAAIRIVGGAPCSLRRSQRRS